MTLGQNIAYPMEIQYHVFTATPALYFALYSDPSNQSQVLSIKICHMLMDSKLCFMVKLYYIVREAKKGSLHFMVLIFIHTTFSG